MFLDVLGELARWPGVRSWTEDTLEAFHAPAKVRAQRAAAAERRAYNPNFDIESETEALDGDQVV